MQGALQDSWDHWQPAAAALESIQQQGGGRALMSAAELHQLFLLLQAHACSRLGQEGGGRQDLRRIGEAATRQLSSQWPSVPAYRLKHAGSLIATGQLAAAAEQLSRVGRLAQERKGEHGLGPEAGRYSGHGVIPMLTSPVTGFATCPPIRAAHACLFGAVQATASLLACAMKGGNGPPKAVTDLVPQAEAWLAAALPAAQWLPPGRYQQLQSDWGMVRRLFPHAVSAAETGCPPASPSGRMHGAPVQPPSPPHSAAQLASQQAATSMPAPTAAQQTPPPQQPAAPAYPAVESQAQPQAQPGAARCAACGRAAEAPVRCGRCRAVSYCNRLCQVRHWLGEHRPECDRVVEANVQERLAASAARGRASSGASTGSP